MCHRCSNSFETRKFSNFPLLNILFRMTKLLEWLTALAVLFAIWFYLITTPNNLVKENYNIVFYSPVIFVALFGVSLAKNISCTTLKLFYYSSMLLQRCCTGFIHSMNARTQQLNYKM